MPLWAKLAATVGLLIFVGLWVWFDSRIHRGFVLAGFVAYLLLLRWAERTLWK